VNRGCARAAGRRLPGLNSVAREAPMSLLSRHFPSLVASRSTIAMRAAHTPALTAAMPPVAWWLIEPA
jgi:hypothetical protein